MLIRVSGGSGGIAEYLAFGRKSGRSESRDELDQRYSLSGQLSNLDLILDAFDRRETTQKYFHITLSFKEAVIDENILQKIDSDFRDFLFTACKDDEFYYYSEAHLPKIKKAIDVNGSEYERFPHIHVVIPQFNLYTGHRDEPFGRVENIIHYINSFQELINEKYRLESPKDNIRELSFGREEILNRYKITSDMSVKDIKLKIFQLVRDHPHISTVEELAEIIRPFGDTRIRDSKKFGAKYINISVPGKSKGINLKDPVFLDDYLVTRDISVTRAYVSADHEALIAKWKDYGALEARFFPKFSRKQREEYAEMHLDDKKALLRARWQSHETHLESLKAESQPIRDLVVATPLVFQEEMSPDIDAIRATEDLPHVDDIRHIDDIPHITDLPHVDDLIFDKERYEQDSSRASRVNLHELRVRRGDGGQRPRAGDEFASDLLPDHQLANVERDEEIPSAELYALPAENRNSVAAGIRDSLTARHELPTWSAIIKAIDGRSLLDYLQYHYRMDAELLSIERSKSGAERIVEGDRRYTASDFLTKRMHLTWPEAKEVLQTVFDGQQRGEWRRRAVTSKLMWARFERYERRLPGIAGVRGDYKRKRDKIRLDHAYRADPSQSKAQNAVRRRLLRESRQAELIRLREAFDAEMRYYLLRPHERYLEYLYESAEHGDRAALGELNRIYPLRERDDRQVFEIRIRERRQPLTQFSPANMGYQIKIKRNGTVEYQNSQSEAVIVDTYNSIKVKDRSAEVIANALQLAKLRYGVNGFEIRNAREEDIAAIKAAVQRTQTQVRVVSTPKNTNPER